eukprot:1145570-Lingulodinium_polyedra.AAC.1
MLGGILYCEALPGGAINIEHDLQLKREYDERVENYLEDKNLVLKCTPFAAARVSVLYALAETQICCA